jgi:hypothetical protein
MLNVELFEREERPLRAALARQLPSRVVGRVAAQAPGLCYRRVHRVMSVWKL